MLLVSDPRTRRSNAVTGLAPVGGPEGLPVTNSNVVASRASAAADDFMWELANFRPSPEDQAALDAVLSSSGGPAEIAALLSRNAAFLLHPLVVRKLLLLRDAADGALALRSKADAAALANLGKDLRDIGQVESPGQADDREKRGDEARRDLLTALAPLLSGGGRGVVAKAQPDDLRRDYCEARYHAREARTWALERRRDSLKGKCRDKSLACRGAWHLVERDVLTLGAALGIQRGTVDQLNAVVAAVCSHRAAESRAALEILALRWGREAVTVRRWVANIPPRVDKSEVETWIAERAASCPCSRIRLNERPGTRCALHDAADSVSK